MASTEIELISDGDGLAVFGKSADVARFLESEGLSSTEIVTSRLGTAFSAGASVAQAGAEIAANSGRWVKLTKESAATVKTYGLMKTKTPGVSHAMVGKPGDIKQWIQIVTSPTSILSNPALLTGAAGLMTQLAMQQKMDEITDYLATIDEKLDSVLRAQTNQILARMDGVDLALREATSVREAVGRVSEVTWSKVQNSSSTVFETQGYALRQLADLAEKLEQTGKLDDLAVTVAKAEADVQKWLTVLARCFQLHDAIAVVELDRILDADPDELDRHRLGLQAARRDRLQLITQATDHLLARMGAVAIKANSKVLLHPTKSPAMVRSSNLVALSVHDFHDVLGIESGRQSSDATRWAEAAGERLDKMRDSGADGIDTVKRLGGQTQSHVKAVKGKLSERLAGRRVPRSELEREDITKAADPPGESDSDQTGGPDQ